MRRRPAPSAAVRGMISIEVSNRSGIDVEEDAAVELARRVLADEGVEEGELGLHFVGPEEIRALKRDHLGVDEVTDVLSFPIDARDELASGVPRQLGDAVLCPQVTGAAWGPPLVHGLLHLLGHDHGSEMAEKESRWSD
jgi:probable rRNA maturation factor